MDLVYIYHSCFAILAPSYAILIDYYRDTNDNIMTGYVHDTLLKREGTLYVLSSHSHPDHFSKDVLGWTDINPNIQYILSDDIRKKFKLDPSVAHFLAKGDKYEDGNLLVEAFGSTDIGISFLITATDRLIFHAGDLNNWLWKDESTAKEISDADKAFMTELSVIEKRTNHVDLAMFPVDPRMGTDFAKGAEEFVDQIKTGVFVPMHFWNRPQLAAEFAPYAESKGAKFVMMTTPGQQASF